MIPLFLFLAPSCFPCPVGVHTVWQYLGHCRGPWAPSHAQVNSKLTMELQAESRGLPALSRDSGALGCVPPWEVDRTTIRHACGGEATSWGNLCTGRQKRSPESPAKSSGSPMTRKNPPAFNNGIDRLVLVNLTAGCYSRYFCLQLPAQPFYTRSLSL